MMPRLITLLALLALLVSGCHSSSASRRHRPAGSTSVVYRAPSDRELNERIAELQKAGQPPDVAERKAKSEFAADAWRTETSTTWAAEKAREERSRTRDAMEKDLASLPKF